MLKTMAKVFGIVLLLVGVLGFIPGVTTTDGNLLGIFRVDALHNIVHLVSGALALWASMSEDSKASRMFFQIFGVVYLILAVLGFITPDGGPLLGLVASNTADTWLHVVLAVVALYLGFGSAEKA